MFENTLFKWLILILNIIFMISLLLTTVFLKLDTNIKLKNLSAEYKSVHEDVICSKKLIQDTTDIITSISKKHS